MAHKPFNIWWKALFIWWIVVSFYCGLFYCIWYCYSIFHFLCRSFSSQDSTFLIQILDCSVQFSCKISPYRTFLVWVSNTKPKLKNKLFLVFIKIQKLQITIHEVLSTFSLKFVKKTYLNSWHFSDTVSSR